MQVQHSFESEQNAICPPFLTNVIESKNHYLFKRENFLSYGFQANADWVSKETSNVVICYTRSLLNLDL